MEYFNCRQIFLFLDVIFDIMLIIFRRLQYVSAKKITFVCH
jgi:hypothetical protein